MSEEYKVKVGQFEGPLELLLDLIEKKKLHINDVSLVEVTDGYLQYINNLEAFPMGDVASFITIASTLILIKSISLLPSVDLTEEEKIDIEDLEKRLLQLKEIKEKGIYINKIFGRNMIFFAEDKKNLQTVFSPTKEINVGSILESIRRVIESFPKTESLPEATVKKVLSLEDAIENLITRIQKDLKLGFGNLHSDTESTKDPEQNRVRKVNIIVNFLAVLELVKRGIILVKQDNHFQEIDIESGKGSLPVYT